jgi:hypothetical protein
MQCGKCLIHGFSSTKINVLITVLNLQPPHPSFWRRIPSPGSSFSLSSPITTFTSTTYQGGVHRGHGRHHHPFPRNHSPHTPHSTTGALNEHFSQGRTQQLPIRHDDDQWASSEGEEPHASEAGLGPAQNGTAPGSPVDRQTGYGRGAGYPNVSMGNSALQRQIRNPQSQTATGHDRTGVGGNIDMSNRHGSIPPPANAQPV